MSSAPTPLVSAEEYLAIERKAESRSELISGHMYAMAGASLAHNTIVLNLAAEIRSALRGSNCGAVAQDMRVKILESGAYTYPDVAVYCGQPRLEDTHQDTLLNPVLIVEVLSESTEAHDRGFKFLHYQRIESLQSYILVSQHEPRVECFARTEGGWTYLQASGLEARLALPAIECEIGLTQIYERVQFE